MEEKIIPQQKNSVNSVLIFITVVRDWQHCNQRRKRREKDESVKELLALRRYAVPGGLGHICTVTVPYPRSESPSKNNYNTHGLRRASIKEIP